MSALARWDAFLAQIAGRHRDVIVEAEATTRAAIAAISGGGDHLPISHQLSAIDARLRDLETKLVDTWHEKVEDAIFADGHGVDVRDAAWKKGDDLKHQLDEAREELPIRMLAELARSRADLTAVVGAHPISQEAAFPEWRAMRAAERAMHAHRSPTPLHALKTYERAQIAYWRAYLHVRARYEPILARDPRMELQKRMEQWYVYSADNEREWVAAGRPREPI
jgi:hypothetical protein